jgi:hypothetical protein
MERELASLDEEERTRTWLMLQQLLAEDANHRMGASGFIDYNDTSTSASPLVLPDGQFVDLPNDGLGPFTNKAFAPLGVTELMDTATGQLDFSELDLGDGVFIRNDFEVTPDVDEAELTIRYTLGTGVGEYTLERTVGQLSRGSGIAYRQSLLTEFIYMGDTNTRDNKATVALRLTGADGLCTNYGVVIEVVKA